MSDIILPGKTIHCPSCGKMLVPRTLFTISIVCTCGTFAMSGAAPALSLYQPMPEDMTLLQVGSKGEWKGKPFEVAGRIRYKMEGAYRNRWFIYFDASSWKWLEEGYGMYAVYEPNEFAVDASGLKGSKPGREKEFPSTGMCWIEALYNIQRYSCEGDLPELPIDKKAIRLEYTNGEGGLVVVHTYGTAEINGLYGYAAKREELKLTQLRSADEWL